MGRNPGGQNWWVTLRRLLEGSSRWPQRHLEAESATLRRARYFTPTSCAGAEPTSAVHLYRGSAHMLASCSDHECFGGVGAELCHRQQPADVKVSGRTGRAMGCGGCAFTCVSCMLHRLQLVIMNIFILSFNLRPTSTRPSSGSQDHQHHRIRCARQLQPCRKMSLEAAESLLLIHLMRMCVLVALRARIERSCSDSVRAR